MFTHVLLHPNQGDSGKKKNNQIFVLEGHTSGLPSYNIQYIIIIKKQHNNNKYIYILYIYAYIILLPMPH